MGWYGSNNLCALLFYSKVASGIQQKDIIFLPSLKEDPKHAENLISMKKNPNGC